MLNNRSRVSIVKMKKRTLKSFVHVESPDVVFIEHGRRRRTEDYIYPCASNDPIACLARRSLLPRGSPPLSIYSSWAGEKNFPM